MNNDLASRLYAQLAGEPELLSYVMGALGATSPAPGEPKHDGFPAHYKNARVYGIKIDLKYAPGSPAGGSVTLEPCDFILRRITWATTGDVLRDAFGNQLDWWGNPGSIQGRAVEMTWSDEFTRFFGSQPMLLSALFGDSNGFLDLPYGIRFKGSQTLSVALTRLFWPGDPGFDNPSSQPTTRFDFAFHGFDLLPIGTTVSGSR